MKFLIKSTVKTVTIEKYESVIEATSSDEAKTIFAGGMERSSYALYKSFTEEGKLSAIFKIMKNTFSSIFAFFLS